MAILNTFHDPTVILDEMAISASVAEDNASSINFTEVAGKYYPLIQLNTFIIDGNRLQYFKLSSDGFIPEIQFSFTDNNKLFKAAFYPKDGDILSVYIKSSEDKVFKPIRIDFDILSFNDSGNNSFSVRGIMNIPLLTTENCKAYRASSSHEVLMEVAQELSLGYAANLDSTNDTMNWLNAYNSYEKFISDVTSRTFLNETSFFTSFIDVYYYLNLIDVNSQFENYEPETGIMKSVPSPKAMTTVGDKDLEDNNSVDLFLTDHPNYTRTNFGIINYKIINSSGEIWRKNGYSRDVQFFDLNDQEYYSLNIESTITSGSENTQILQRGRPGDMVYEDIKKYKFLGSQLTSVENPEEDRPNTSNVHRNYQYSKILNLHNNEELKKILIKATLPTVNSQLYRYQTVPVLFYEDNIEIINTLNTRDREVESTTEREINGTSNIESLKLNTLISGLYVIQGINYIWDEFSETVKQELILLRREWPIQLPKNFESKNIRKS